MSRPFSKLSSSASARSSTVPNTGVKQSVRTDITRSADSAPTTGGSTASKTTTNGFEQFRLDEPEDESARGKLPSFQTSFNSSGRGGGALRPISETFDINPANGTFSLSVPIRVSSARSDFEPHIALAYDSGRGNGAFGLGWALTLPAVARKTSRQIPLYDDDKDEYTLTDDLVELVGDKLIDGNFVLQRYRRRAEEGIIRIERWTDCFDPTEVHWRTISADNTTSIYGKDDTSRICDFSSGGRRVYSWLLCRQYDSHGNAIEYIYKSEDSAGISDVVPVPCWETSRAEDSRHRQRYIKSIRYGNRTTNRNMQTWAPNSWPKEWVFELVFDYGDHDQTLPTTTEDGKWLVRQDPFSSCSCGFEIRTYRLCRRILMFHHFEDELHRVDNLVSALELAYKESPHASFLSGVTERGYAAMPEGNGYRSTAMPSFSFEYSTVPSREELEIQSADTSELYFLPSSQKYSGDWVDLDGEGMPGLLARLPDGGVFYQRNKNALRHENDIPHLEPLQLLASWPNVSHDLKHFYFEDLDRNGRQDLVCLSSSRGTLEGFYERDDDRSWCDFSTFPTSPTDDLAVGDILRMDLTGDGLLDLLHANSSGNGVVWQESLAKQGFGSRRLRPWSDTTNIPHMSHDPSTRIYTTDMTGDGLSDLVELSNAKISYWPNLGYGLFGKEVCMANSPVLDSQNHFSQARVRLIDVDGTGVADLIYLLPGGGANLYYNYSGNAWSDPIFLSQVPEFDSLSSIFILDIFGKGTSCLCWSGGCNNGSSQPGLSYMDLMGDTKPHLLRKYSNGFGYEVDIEYKPSTTFYMEDEAAECPWKTRIPFPVHCVNKVSRKDCITNAAKLTTYAYHDGYYNTIERVFGGFAFVEQWDEEDFSTASKVDFRGLRAYQKMWYSTGAASSACPERTFPANQQLHTKLNEDIHTSEYCDAYQSLKGKSLRLERYDCDKTDVSPYLVEEYSYDIRQLQAPLGRNFGAYMVTQAELLKSHYEKDISDPRVEHEIFLSRNKYGDVERKLSVSYPRTSSRLSNGLTDMDVAVQKKAIVRYTVSEYTKPVDTLVDFRKPQRWSNTEYAIFGLDLASLLRRPYLDTLKFDVLTESSSADLFRTVASGERIYFWSGDMKKALLAGELETYSVEHQRYTLAMTTEILDSVAALGSNPSTQKISEILADGGFVDLDQNGRWWAPSNRHLFSDFENSDSQLSHARRLFYLPTITVDPMGNLTKQALDKYRLLPLWSEDSLENHISFENDYERMRPFMIKDANKNRQEVRYDEFGNIVAMAVMGKEGEEVGDLLDDMVLPVQAVELESLITDPTGAIAERMLGKAGRRTVFSLSRQPHSAGQTTSALEPVTVISLRRDRTYRDATESLFLVEVVYLDGHGRPLLSADLADSDGTFSKWRFQECTLLDSEGRPVQTFQPFYRDTHTFLPPSEIKSPSTIKFVDTMGRVRGSLRSDQLWSKVQQTAWSEVSYDFGDTILIDNPAADPDIGPYLSKLDPDAYPPTWMQRSRQGSPQQRLAAEKSETYSNTFIIRHTDVAGRPILLLEDDGSGSSQSQRYTYDINGHRTSHTDALGRIAEECIYDLLGHCLYRGSMDSGQTWTLSNCQSYPIFSVSSSGTCLRKVYDGLGREIEIRMQQGSASSSLVISKTYGESVDQAEKCNLRGKLWRVRDQSGESVNTSYDIRGNCTATTVQLAEQYKSMIDWEQNVSLQSAVPFQHSQRYDTLDRVIRETDARENTTRYAHKRIHGISKVEFLDASLREASSPSSLSTMYLTNAEYAADNQPLLFSYGNGTTQTFEYDKHSRQLLRERSIRGSKSVLEDVQNTYDCVGRLIRTEDASQETIYYRNYAVHPVSEYTYDAAGRLTQAQGREQLKNGSGSEASLLAPTAQTGSTPTADLGDKGRMCEYTEAYTYDAAGNLLKMRHSASQDTSVSGWTRKYYYEEASMLEPTRFSNRLSRTAVGGVTEQYGYGSGAGKLGCMTTMPGYSLLSWNYHSMLHSTATQRVKDGTPQTTYYIYNHEGQRVRKVTESQAAAAERTSKIKETIYLSNLSLYSEFRISNPAPTKFTATAEVRALERLALVETNALSMQTIVRYQIGQKMELDEQSRLISYEEFSPFGTCTYYARGKSIEAPRMYRFFRYQRDTETGLDVCGARYYASWLGRWTSPDPLGTVDGPNLYAYVKNDPVNYHDHTGTMQNTRRGGDIRLQINNVKDAVAFNAKKEEFEKGPLMTRVGQAIKEGAISGGRSLLVAGIKYGTGTAVSLATAAVIVSFGPLTKLQIAGVALGLGAVKAGVDKLANHFIIDKDKKEKEEKAAEKLAIDSANAGLEIGIAQASEEAFKTAEKVLAPTSQIPEIVVTDKAAQASKKKMVPKRGLGEYDLQSKL
jgi:RHS repeat-associated protein